MPLGLGGWEIGIILVLVLIIFGVGKLPQVGGAVGKSMREFRKEKEAWEQEDVLSQLSAPPQEERVMVKAQSQPTEKPRPQPKARQRAKPSSKQAKPNSQI